MGKFDLPEANSSALPLQPGSPAWKEARIAAYVREDETVERARRVLQVKKKVAGVLEEDDSTKGEKEER